MGFSLKKLLEGAAAQINMNDSGKTFATVVRNQPVQSQPATFEKKTSARLRIKED